jgi:hypothetical protein
MLASCRSRREYLPNRSTLRLDSPDERRPDIEGSEQHLGLLKREAGLSDRKLQEVEGAGKSVGTECRGDAAHRDLIRTNDPSARLSQGKNFGVRSTAEAHRLVISAQRILFVRNIKRDARELNLSRVNRLLYLTSRRFARDLSMRTGGQNDVVRGQVGDNANRVSVTERDGNAGINDNRAA